MSEKEKKITDTITIRFNVTESDKEMRAILTALPTSDRVEFIKECVMVQSRRILRNETESLKMDVVSLKEKYIQNGVNIPGVTIESLDNDTTKILKQIGLLFETVGKQEAIAEECQNIKIDNSQSNDIVNDDINKEVSIDLENDNDEDLNDCSEEGEYSEYDELEDEEVGYIPEDEDDILDDDAGDIPPDSFEDEE